MKALLAGVLLLYSGVSHAATLERSFHFPASGLTTRWSHDTVSVRLAGGLGETRPGAPDLPVMAEKIEIPKGMRIRSVIAQNARFEPVAASAVVRPVNGAPARGAAAWNGASPLVEVGYQGSMRGRTLAWLLVHPVRWDAATRRLDRLVSVDTRVELESATGDGVLQRERIVPEWEGDAPTIASIPKQSAQPFKPTQLPSVLGSPVAYVIVTTDALLPQFQRLADWKTQAGVPAVVRSLTTIRQEYPGTDDADRIRRFLRDAYVRWGTKWALLGGDTHVIPTRTAYTTFYVTEPGTYNDIPTDLYFSCLDGNWNADGDSLYGEGDSISPIDNADLLPEIWVGRAPVATLTEAQQFVDKVFQYSRTPVGDYEKNILFFAEMLDPKDWTPGDPIFLDGAQLVEECLPAIKANASMRYARLYENYLDPSYEPGAIQELRRRVLDSLSVGYNLAIHAGHGFRNVMSVGDSNITNADATTLTNGNRLTNFYSVSCTSNAVDYPCLGEALMKAPNGGAVSNIGSTRLDFPSTGRAYEQEYFHLVFHDSVSAIGEAQGRQKLPFVAGAKYDNTHRWTQMALLLLGDPEMHLWTGKPRTLSVTKPASIVANDTTFSVHVEIAGVPLYGARVTAYKAGDDYASVLTNGAGNATLDFRPDGAGTLTLTVTGYDCIPYQGSISITGAAGPLLVESTTTVDDDNTGGTSGNADGVLDAGEVVDLTIPIRNAGTSTSATSVTGVLSTSNPAVTMLVPNVLYGTIAAGATVTGPTRFRFQTSYTAADQAELAFTLSITDAASHHFQEPLRLTLHSPELRSYGHTVIETVGDGDGRPEPGETVSYTVSLRNSGSGVARSVSAILRRLDTNSNVTDSTSTLGNIAGGATVSGDAFAFSVSGASAAFELRISTSQGLIATQKIDLGWPGVPQNLSGLGGSSTVRLTWLASPEPDLAGYDVYRSSALAGPYTRLNAVPADRTAYYTDEGLSQLTRYFYKVSAVDSSGNESALSSPLSISTSPPTHTVFPIAIDANSSSSVTVAKIYAQSPMDIIAGGDQHLYVWHADGTAPVDADLSSVTSGDFSSQGSGFRGGASAADLDGGAMEIIAPTWFDQSVYVYDLQGQVKPGWPFNAGESIWSLVAVGDLDKNGSKELVFGSNGNKLFALRSNGTEWIDGDSNPSTQGVFKVLGNTYNYGTPALADIDKDGFLDIVYSSWDHDLYAWHSNGTNLPGFPIDLGGESKSSVAIGYLDGTGDNQLEIVATAGDGDDSLYVFEPGGSRRFAVPLRTGGGTGKEPSPAIADINGDGFNDIVAAGTDGLLKVFDRNGALLPAFSNVRFSSLTAVATESSPVVADINGDGFNDIVIGDNNATLSAFDRNGQLLSGFPIALGGEAKGTPALCDCDGDGKTEIALSGWDGMVYVWDYDFPFSPGKTPPWPQFHHDAMHTGLASPETAVAVPPANVPKRLAMSVPIPNPVRLRASFSYDIPLGFEGKSYSLDVFDPAGRRVRRLAHGAAEPGHFDFQWDLRDGQGGFVSSGLYLLVLDVGGERRSRRVVALP